MISRGQIYFAVASEFNDLNEFRLRLTSCAQLRFVLGHFRRSETLPTYNAPTSWHNPVNLLGSTHTDEIRCGRFRI